ncbi:MAG: SdpI family protein [Actinobacteria bacterium]|nr:SdpI family protein [Actinomycetota bacterium]
MSRLTLYAPFFFGLLLAGTGGLGMTGRLPKNDWFGIRMHVVMSSDAAWLAGHHAGGPWLLAGGLVALAAGVALLVVWPDAVTGARITTVSLSAAFVLAGVAAWRAQSAARRVL